MAGIVDATDATARITDRAAPARYARIESYQKTEWQTRATDALLEQSDQIAASQPQPRSPATNCAWSGNTLNCTTLR
jgi:hypothetical protein